MSRSLYLECLSHNPPIRAMGESGQHDVDMETIRVDVSRRSEIVEFLRLGRELGFMVGCADPFRQATMHFLYEHPECRLGIRDGNGHQIPIDDGGDDA